MIAANGVTAKYLERKGFPSLRRVLRSPERWERIVELAARLGGRLPPEPSALALEEFLAERRQADPGTVSRPLPLRGQAPGFGRVRRRASRADARTDTSGSR